MQVARLMQPKPRTVKNKLIEMIQALKIELKYSKEQILKLYLLHAPYGSNIIGYRTAALRYFAELPEVGSVQLLRVTDDRILLGLESQGGVEHLQRMLALDRTLAAATPVAGEADLTYHWRGR